MAITFVSATTAGTNAGFGIAGNSTVTVTLPSYSAGNVGIILVYMDSGTCSIDQSWNTVSGAPWGSNTPKLYAFYKVLGASETNPVITSASTGGTTHTTVAGCVVYSGVDTTTPIHVVGSATSGTGTPNTCAGITTTVANAMLLGLCGRGDNEAYSGQSVDGSTTGVAERLDVGTLTGDDGMVCIYDKTIASAGATGNGSATTSATDPYVSVFISLKPGITVKEFADASLPLSSLGSTTTKLKLDTAFADAELALSSLTSTPNLDLPNDSPTVALNTTNATEFILGDFPVLEFTGTDTEAEDVLYEIQIDTANTFDTGNLIDKVSGTDLGFGDTTTERISNKTMDSNITGWSSSSFTETWYSTDDDSIGRTNVLKCVATGTSNQRVDTDDAYFGADLPSGSTIRIHFSIYIPSTNGSMDGVEVFDYVTSTQIFGTSFPTANTWVHEVINATLNELKDGLGFRARDGGVTSNITINDKLYLDNISLQLYEADGQYPSGNKISYAHDGGLADGTYYWRVRAKDPAGSNTFGDWSETRSFTVGDVVTYVEFSDTLGLTSLTSDSKLNRVTAYADTIALTSLTSDAKLNRITAYADTLALSSLTSSAKLSLLNAFADTLALSSLTGDAQLNIFIAFTDTLNLTSLTGDASLRRIMQYADTVNLTSLTSDVKLTLLKVFSDTIALSSLTSNAKLSLIASFTDTLNLTSLTSSPGLVTGTLFNFADTLGLTSLTSSAKLKLIGNFSDTLNLTSLTSDAKLYKWVEFLDTLNLTSLTSTPLLATNNIVSFADTLALSSLTSDAKITLVKNYSDLLGLTSLMSDAKMTKLIAFSDAIGLTSLTSDASLSTGSIIAFADTLGLTSLTSSPKLSRIIAYADTINFTSLTSDAGLRRLIQYIDALGLTSLTGSAKLFRTVAYSDTLGLTSLVSDANMTMGGLVYYTDTLALTSLTNSPVLTLSITGKMYYWDGVSWVQITGITI